jgi:hypothetical protein
MSFDLIKHDPAKLAEAGYTFPIVTPDGNIQEATLTVRGAHSAKVRTFQRSIQNQWQQRDAAAKRRGKEKADELTPEEYDELGVRSACARLIGWTGLVENGKEVVYSESEAERLMTAHQFLRELVVSESENSGNFTQKKTSLKP